MIDYANLAPGQRIADRYRIERRIGQGQSSAVYHAVDETIGSPVALKILDPFLSHDEVSVERFRREVEIVRALEHPGVIEIYDFVQEGDLYAICMQLVEGEDLATRLRREGPMPVDEFLRLAPLALAAVAACHREGVLHRDIKPQNLLLDGRGQLFLSDFGISKLSTMSDLTKTGSVIGTPEYMAPELFRSGRADPRSDIYALGAVFYEMLAGTPPHAGTTLTSVMTQQLENAVEPLHQVRPEIPPWIDAIVARCLRVDPDDRYQSPDEIETELARKERALAVYRAANDPAACLSCGVEMVPGLPFCHDCGRFGHEVFEPGPFHVVLYRADEPELLREYLARFFPKLPRWRTALRLSLRPTVLFAGLSEGAANGLYNELAASFCEIGVSRRLPAEMRLPWWMTVLTLLLVPGFGALFYEALLAMGYGDVRTGPILSLFIGAAPVASLATLVGLYRWKVRPLVSFRRARARVGAGRSQLAAELAHSLRDVHSASTRRLLGGIAANVFAIRAASTREGARGGLPSAAIEDLARACYRAARTLDLYNAQLSGRSVMAIRDRLDRLAIRIARSEDTTELETMVKDRSDLEQELADYRETEERHARLHLAVLGAGGTLEKARNAVQGGESRARAVRRELAAELAAAAADLTQL